MRHYGVSGFKVAISASVVSVQLLRKQLLCLVSSLPANANASAVAVA